jgi:hypothetical protein
MVNHNKIWFKRKLYGWGWTPSSWEGWLVMALYLGALILIFRNINKNSHSVSDTLIGFVVPLIVSMIIISVICYWKGETPRWQWGKRTDDH